MTDLATSNTSTPAARLTGWDSIEFWVGNARAMAGFLTGAFGFRVTAYAGPETGRPDKASYLLEQGSIRLVVTVGSHARIARSGTTSASTVTAPTIWRSSSTTRPPPTKRRSRAAPARSTSRTS